ncbi:MAG: SRPBCC family protein [Deltaproteobacteria bacterium]|nr:SRPBCC family protein [Deltaproteobacteria bacterium]
MKVEKQATVEVQAPVDQVFDFAADHENFHRFVGKKGILPGVVGSETIGEGKYEPGCRRRLTMTDGSEMVEEVVACARPSCFVYRWGSRPKPPFSLLVRGAEARWTFAATQGGTRVCWQYALELTTPLVWPLATLVMVAFGTWMEAALSGLGKAMQEKEKGQPAPMSAVVSPSAARRG